VIWSCILYPSSLQAVVAVANGRSISFATLLVVRISHLHVTMCTTCYSSFFLHHSFSGHQWRLEDRTFELTGSNSTRNFMKFSFLGGPENSKKVLTILCSAIHVLRSDRLSDQSSLHLQANHIQLVGATSKEPSLHSPSTSHVFWNLLPLRLQPSLRWA
jgi:hypothetical protein